MKTFFLENSWASASDFIFDIFKLNKYMEDSFLFTFSWAKKPRGFKTGKLKFAFQGSSSFDEVSFFFHAI